MAGPSPPRATAGEDSPGRTAFEVADVVRAYGVGFLSTHPTSGAQRRVLRTIGRCRTGALGGHVEGCDACGHTRIAYNSCRNRHCPKCQGQQRAQWMAAEQATLLLPVEYFHVVFTLPHAFNTLIRMNPRQLYGLLFQAAAATLLAFARDPKHLGGEPAITMVLHTWGQNLTAHAHVHCVVSGGGLSADARRWHATKRRGFLFPVKALSKLCRGKYLATLDRLQRTRALRFAGQSAHLSEAAHWLQLLTELRRTQWVVYAKPPFGGPQCVLKYLSRYTHRVAIANRRIRFVGDGIVRVAWKDYADHNVTKEMTLSAEEFLRRFLLHVLPRGFMRIRHYGLLANRHRGPKLARCRELLGVGAAPPAASADLDDTGSGRADDADGHTEPLPAPCPVCGQPMRVLDILAPHRRDTS
jgi:hypothetical protein